MRGHVPEPMSAGRWVRAWVAMLLLSGFVPPAASGQAVPAAASSPREAPAAPAPPAIPPAEEAVYTGAAVVASGANIAAREVLCGVGEIVGFFTLAVIRLPVWAATMGDRFGSSKPLDRLGNSIIEKACEGPWIVTPEQIKALGRPPGDGR
jgi:hypothetical protein